jgi:membrane peptidoglycan carboxypeptidase
MATALSSIANGGMLMRPHLVRAVIRDGVRHPVAPEALRRTIKADTAAELTTIMEGVVERGTGKPARIDGYTIAGKTGTAAKLINGEYSKQKYFSSFIGFMPSRKPAIAVLVMVDAPSAGPYFGGLVAAPIFKRIGEIAVRHLGIPRSINPETPVDAVLPYLGDIDLLLVMSVHPGWGGQGFIPEVLDKVRVVRSEIDERGLASSPPEGAAVRHRASPRPARRRHRVSRGAAARASAAPPATRTSRNHDPVGLLGALVGPAC